MKTAIIALLFVFLIGCRKNTDASVMSGTHKVWFNADYLEYEGPEGLGCGNIERQNNGWLYHAHVINWTSIEGHTPDTEWNTLGEAQRFVERWCKP